MPLKRDRASGCQLHHTLLARSRRRLSSAGSSDTAFSVRRKGMEEGRMESSLASICKLLKEGKVEDARKLYETIFSYYSEDADLWLEVEFLKRALPIVAQIRSRKDTLDWISSIVQEDIKDLEAILRKRYRVFEEVDQHQERRER